MAITGKTVAVTDTATLVTNLGSRNLYNGDKLLVSLHNADGTDAVYLGGADVTDANAGVMLAAGDRATLEFAAGAGELYAVCATGLAANLNVLVGAAVTHFV